MQGRGLEKSSWVSLSLKTRYMLCVDVCGGDVATDVTYIVNCWQDVPTVCKIY
jgi:hypothetical protein